jgi:hypothetical protein
MTGVLKAIDIRAIRPERVGGIDKLVESAAEEPEKLFACAEGSGWSAVCGQAFRTSSCLA